MTKKKMCPWHKRAACSVDHTEYNYDKYKYIRHACPKNVNDKCEVIEKDIVIKAWFIRLPKEGLLWEIFSLKKVGLYRYPVDIHIKASDYKKLKGEK